MNKEQLKEFLPHREPMLLLDSLIVDPDKTGHGEYTIKDNDFFCLDPGIGEKIVTGSVLCEIMAQTCLCVAMDRIKEYIPLYTTMNKVNFNGFVKVGDKCITTARELAEKAGIIFCGISLEVNGEVKCEGEFSCALVAR